MVEVQLQVLRRDDVHGLERLRDVAAHHDEPLVGQRRRGDLGARGRFQVSLHGALHLVGVGFVERHQVARRQRIVLGLGHEVDGHERRVGVASATTHTSDGPAIMSIPTSPDTTFFAAAT